MGETATEPTDWELIWAQRADDELVRTVVTRSAEQIESFLVSDDQTEEETLALLGRRLSEPIGPATYDVVRDALRALLGEEGANVVHWYIVADGAETGILEQVAPARVAFFVRRIAAAHLPEFQAAYALWKELPDDWRTIHRDVYFDYINQRHIVRHRIQKVSGDEIIIEGNANSVLDLARGFLISTRLVGSRDAFGEPTIEAFLEEADAVLAMLRPQEQPSQDGDGDGDGDVGDFGQLPGD
jgi:hypothetical protein